MRLFSYSLLSLAIAQPLSAEVAPTPGSGDPRIQTVAYDAFEVVALNFSAGFSLTVQFSPDEQIETVIIGDSGNWTTQTSRRADHLVLMPIGAPMPTNMTVFTDQRTYNFVLYPYPATTQPTPHLVSFTYPAPVSSQTKVVPIAGRYRLRGSEELRPLRIADDGQKTTIQWADDITLPAVYSETERGELALINGVMREGNLVLDAVYSRLVFVRGKARARALRIETKP